MSLASLLMPEGEFRVVRCDVVDKLIQCGDGDAALLYLYVIRQGRAFDEQTAKRDLRLSDERFTRASFTLTGLVVEQQPAAPARPEHAPRYTAAELRRARQQDHRFQAVCDAAENVLGHALTDALLRTLYTVYDHIALPAEVIIELLSYLGRDRGTFKGRDIEREACIWADKGILTTADAQRSLVALCLEKGFAPDALELAMARMKRGIGTFSASYLRKMLASWDQKGVHTVAEITALEPESARRQEAAAPVSRPPFGAAPAQAPREEQLADWEKEWLAEVQRRKAKQGG